MECGAAPPLPPRRRAAKHSGARFSSLRTLTGAVVWSGLAAAASAAQQWYPSLVLTGACDAKESLNGLVFEFQGHTASGAPFYKAQAKSEYLYYDPGCSGSDEGTARWIFDSDAPNVKAERDLDGDGFCDYHGRIDSLDKSLPPATANWCMRCDGADACQQTFLLLAPITTTSTSTTVSSTTTSSSSTSSSTTGTTTSTTATSTTVTRTSTTVSSTTSTTVSSTTSTSSTTSVTRTSTTATTTTTTSSTATTTTSTSVTSSTSTSATVTSTTNTASTTTLVKIMQMGGACAYKDFLNGATFVSHGYSANGAMVFKALGAEQYMYYDMDCDGGGDGQPRWIIDFGQPNVSRTEDLDEDGACNYHARLDSDGWSLSPPAEAVWTIYCGRGWVQQTLRFTETPLMPNVGEGGAGSSGAGHSGNGGDEPGPAPELEVEGEFCRERHSLTGMRFRMAGRTQTGAPFYRAEAEPLYIYYDPDCSGNATGSGPHGRWLIDMDPPSTERYSDLDEDGQCDYLARSESAESRWPPDETMWRVFCGEEWQDFWVTLIPLHPTTTTTAAPPSAAPKTTSAPHGAVPPGMGSLDSSAANRRVAVAAAAILAGAALLAA